MTDYARLIREENPYEALLRDDQARATRGAVAGAVATQPDVEAKLRMLSERVGVPLESVRVQQPQIEREAQIGSIDYEKLVRDTPRTAAFLEQQAPVARDDVDTLTRIDRAFTAFGQEFEKSSKADTLGPLHYRAMLGQLSPAEQEQRQKLESEIKAIDVVSKKGDSTLSWVLGVSGAAVREYYTQLREAAPGAVFGAGAGMAGAALIGQMGPQAAFPEEILTIPAGGVFGATSGFVTASVVNNYQRQAGFAFAEFENLRDTNGQLMPRDVAVGAAIAVGLLNSGLETVANVALLKAIPGVDRLLAAGSKNAIKALLTKPTFQAAIAQAGKKWAVAAGTEGLTEAAQELISIIGREVAEGVAPGVFPDQPPGADIERILVAGAEGAVGGAAISGGPTAVQAGMNIREVRRAQQTEQFMRALGEDAQASKLRERLPEVFKEFVAKAREGGPVENIYIPAEQFARYFQSQNVDPAAVATEVGARNYGEALAAGTDIVIPLEDYATYLAATKHHQGLMQDVRLHQGDLTMREAEQFQKDRKEIEDQILEQMKRDTGEIKTPAGEQVKQQVMGELVGRFEPTTADAYATLYAKAISSLAERAGMDAMELHQTYGLKVVTPLPAVLRQRGDADINLDPMLDRLRMGDIPTEKQIYGESLTEFIRRRGGLKPTTGIVDADKNLRPFQRRLIRDDGLPVDLMFEAAIEAGYFPGAELSLTMPRVFLDAIDDELSGFKTTYVAGEERADLRDLAASLDALDRYLTEAGIDLSMDNAQIRALLAKAAEFSEQEGATQFEQSATIRAGRETLKKYGLKPGQRYKTRQVAAALEARQRAKYGTIARDDQSAEAEAKISKWMVEEVLFEMQHPERSGIGWYSEKFQRALDVFGEVFPELQTDQNARNVLTALIAITSDGQKVVPNFSQAIDAYSNFRDTGKFTTARGHIRQESILNNLANIQELYDTLGPEGMRDYLMQEDTVSNLKKRATEEGVKFSSDYQAAIKLPMAALVFGPKLGAFYANLMGAHGYLTMDRWWSRTFNRYRGTLLDRPTQAGLKRFRQLLGDDKGIDTAEMSDDELLAATVEYRDSYEAKKFKEGTEIEKAANTIYKAAFESLEDAPFNATDRTFMLNAVKRAQKSLQRRGAGMSIADIQAVLWYYEKRLYGELGAKQTADISYEEAARKVADTFQAGGGDRSRRLADLSAAEASVEEADGVVSPGEDDYVEEDGDVTLFQGQAGAQTLADVEAQWDAAGIQHSMAEKGRVITLSRIVVPKDERQAGKGTAAMQALVDYADSTGQRIALSPSADFGGTKKRLMEFYKRFGFVENKGRSKDFAISETMIREPQAGRVTMFQPAFHGTRARGITQFSTEFMGTGEGSQAFGWGLYFADRREVAEFYREFVTPTVYTSNGRQLTGDEAWAAQFLFDEYTGKSINAEAAKSEMRLTVNQKTAEGKAKTKALERYIDDLAGTEISLLEEGQVYEVDIPEDSEMLLWDTPLTEQDAAKWREIAQEEELPVQYTQPALMDERTGEDFYKALSAELGSDRAASQVLASYGVKGIKYRDGVSRGSPDGTFNYVIFSGDDVAIRNQFYQREPSAEADDKRGFIQFGADRKFTIGLLEKADLSTFVHETGHFWLEVIGDLAERPGTSDQIRQDYQTLLNWFGVKSRAEITVEHHEKFARANEAYLFEGKAPSAELRGIFQRVRAWMMLVYRTLSRLNVEMTDEVRGVFDRIYATDEEIQAAQREMDVKPLFTQAEQAGLTQAEFQAYETSVRQATEQAKEELQAKLMREYQREREAWWKERRTAMLSEVTEEVDALREYQAMAVLTGGELPDGTKLKLSKDALVRRYGEAYLKRLPRGFQRVYTTRGGVDPDTAAEIFGFDSGDEMIQSLVALRPRRELIEAEADKRMAEQYGDMRLDGTIAEQAMQALHGEQRERVLQTELMALNRQMGRRGPSTPAAVFKAAAKSMVGQMQAKDLRPYQYLQAERRASKAAFEAAANKDFAAAAQAKQRELMNHFLYLESSRAKESVESVYKYVAKFNKAATRQKLGKAGADYLDQIDAILERYEFKKVSLTALGRRKSLLEFVEEMESQGLLVNVPDQLLDEAKRTNYREATVDELLAVRDTIKNIEHLATLKNKLLRKREQIEFEDVKGELIASAVNNIAPSGELGIPNRKGESIRDRGARLWKWFDAKHLKVEQVIEWLDGGKVDGPWAKFVFDLAADAQTREFELHQSVTKQLQDLAESMPKAWRDSMTDRIAVQLPGIEGPVTRYTLLSVALNAGNAGNLQRLRDGYGWTDATIEAALEKLNADDARFVQGVWDTVNSLWPEIVALEKRVTGVAPPKVEATPVKIGEVEVSGGYFPLAYDPRMSTVGEKQAEATESVGAFMASAYSRARTDKGYTKQRVETVKAPVLLDFEQVLTSHMGKVIKDLSHREAIYSLNKILRDQQIKETLIGTVGEEQYRELTRWSQVLVADRADTLHQATGMAAYLMKFRTNMAIVTMGWKISTMMAQFAGFGPSMDTVKPRFLTQALVDYNRYGPFSKHRETLNNMVYEKSGEMRFRADALERDVRDALRRLQGDTSPLAAVRKTAFYLTAMADRQVSIPTWIGAYRQALAEGLTEEDAVRAGDRAVRLSQGAGGQKDLAAVQRDNELMKLLTMYYSPFSVLYARLRDLGHTTRRVQDMPRAVARVLSLVILPAVLGELLTAKGPDEDEDEIWWAIRKMLLYPVASIPVVRDLSSYLEASMINLVGEGEMQFAPDFRLSPVVGAMDKLARLVFLRLPEAASGTRDWDDVAWDALEMSGYVLGLPTQQVRITGEYITDVLTDKASPESPQEALHDLLFRRPKERQ